MRANKEITQDEYLFKRVKLEKIINHYAELIGNLKNIKDQKRKKLTKAYELVNELVVKFKGSNKNESVNKNNKKAILLNLGSNPLLEDRKAHFCLDLRFEQFKKYSKSANIEIAQVQTSKSNQCNVKTGTLVPAYTTRCAH